MNTDRLMTSLIDNPDVARAPRLGVGCEQLGAYEWGEVDVKAIEAAIAAAFEHGLKLFDTADCYGRGESERRLGRILAGVRDRVFIATKFGVRFDNTGKVFYDSSPEWAETALHQSLIRLGSDYVDLFQIHYWDGRTPLELTLDRLEKFRTSGLIRWYGITNFASISLVENSQYSGFASVSLEYSLVERRFEDVARRVTASGLSFLAYGCLAQGLLSGKYGAAQKFNVGDRRARVEYRNFHGDRYRRNLAIVEVLREEAKVLSATLPQLAIAWILSQVPYSVPLVGIKSVVQLKDIVGALQLDLPLHTIHRLDEISR